MKTYLRCLLAGVIFITSLTLPVVAQQKSDVPTLDQVRAKVAKIGVGEKAKATVTLKNGTKKQGYIGQAGSEDFVLRDRKTDAPTTISYGDVAKLESSRGHSTARNIALGIGIGVGALLTVILIVIARAD